MSNYEHDQPSIGAPQPSPYGAPERKAPRENREIKEPDADEDDKVRVTAPRRNADSQD